MAILNGRSLAAVVVALVLMAQGALAQVPTSTCASKLVPCQAYLGSAKPPESCCNPLKQAVQEQLSCLCALFNDPDVFKAFKINRQQALDLPVHCGIADNITACSAPPPGASNTPPATPGNNSGHLMAWIGMSGLTSLFLVLWSILA